MFERGVVILAMSAGVAWAALPAMASTDAPPRLPTAAVAAAPAAEPASFDGVVEALRQTVIAAQVAGPIVELAVKPGDIVKAGQLLLRIDARAAEQSAAASDAQVQAARAQLELAKRELERQRQLFEQQYISRAALDRAQAEFDATRAQVAAQLAGAQAVRTQSGFYVVNAPYAGVVADVPVSLGDMAMPGRPLLTVYDPQALRVTAAVPQTVLARLGAGDAVRAELPGLPAERRWMNPARTTVLPIVDAATHTGQIRLDLPAGTAGVTPGMFARAWLPAAAAAGARLTVPTRAVVRRAEMTGLYVLDGEGRPLLRQVRLGRAQGESVEVLSGVSAGDRVVIDPQAAARATR
ncbi:MAG: efflux RND transporter periplasmic adaptor subunit [Betaproteobacteria bacterium]